MLKKTRTIIGLLAIAYGDWSWAMEGDEACYEGFLVFDM